MTATYLIHLNNHMASNCTIIENLPASQDSANLLLDFTQCVDLLNITFNRKVDVYVCNILNDTRTTTVEDTIRFQSNSGEVTLSYIIQAIYISVPLTETIIYDNVEGTHVVSDGIITFTDLVSRGGTRFSLSIDNSNIVNFGGLASCNASISTVFSIMKQSNIVSPIDNQGCGPNILAYTTENPNVLMIVVRDNGYIYGINGNKLEVNHIDNCESVLSNFDLLVPSTVDNVLVYVLTGFVYGKWYIVEDICEFEDRLLLSSFRNFYSALHRVEF